MRALKAKYKSVLDGAIKDDENNKEKDDFPNRLPLFICDEPLKASDKTRKENNEKAARMRTATKMRTAARKTDPFKKQKLESRSKPLTNKKILSKSVHSKVLMKGSFD